MKSVGWAIVAVLVCALAPAAIAAPDTNPAPHSAGVGGVGCRDVDAILATIRHHESRGDYTVHAAGSTASGAYQFINSTWAGYGGYSTAAAAPPDVQDAKATEMVNAVLADHGTVDAVPVVWYLGHLPASDSPKWDTIPAPDAGNVLTPREYQTRWMDHYNTVAAQGCTTTGGVYDATTFPQSFTCSQLVWSGQTNGHIAASVLAYRPSTGQMHPQAGADYHRLYTAGLDAGFDLAGSSYRNAAGQAAVHAGGTGAPVGSSCHGLGVAIDIAVLVPCNRANCPARQKYRTTAQAFASPEYAWLCANAHHYGFIHPRWAAPTGNTCGPVTGTGTGGGNSSVLEPWHWEAAGVITTHPDFNNT